MHIFELFSSPDGVGEFGPKFNTLDQNEIKSNLWFMSYLLKKTIRLGPT